MSGIDLGGLLGKLTGGGGDLGQMGGALMGMFGGGGGAGGALTGLLNQLQQGGLGDQVQSWIGTGDNKQVSGPQVKQALGEANVQKLAQDAGLSEDKAADRLANDLPQIVDKISPDGKLPDVGQLDDMLGKFLK
jgi:uncharacterized protein YidB (DUF937 family)